MSRGVSRSAAGTGAVLNLEQGILHQTYQTWGFPKRAGMASSSPLTPAAGLCSPSPAGTISSCCLSSCPGAPRPCALCSKGKDRTQPQTGAPFPSILTKGYPVKGSVQLPSCCSPWQHTLPACTRLCPQQCHFLILIWSLGPLVFQVNPPAGLRSDDSLLHSINIFSGLPLPFSFQKHCFPLGPLPAPDAGCAPAALQSLLAWGSYTSVNVNWIHQSLLGRGPQSPSWLGLVQAGAERADVLLLLSKRCRHTAWLPGGARRAAAVPVPAGTRSQHGSQLGQGACFFYRGSTFAPSEGLEM